MAVNLSVSERSPSGGIQPQGQPTGTRKEFNVRPTHSMPP